MSYDTIGWTSPMVTPEVASLIERIRHTENRISKEFQAIGARRTDELTRTIIVGAARDACAPPLDLSLRLDELCEHCLEARGPLERGPARRMLRERARIHLVLANGSHGLRCRCDLLEMWDAATRREPEIRQFVGEPRWRTAADGTPFTGTKLAAIYGVTPLSPGNETADPEDIPELAEDIVRFATRDDLPPEVVALGLLYLVFRVHPFVDGNGRTARMLSSCLMHRAGYNEATLLAYVDGYRIHRGESCRLSQRVSLGSARTEDHVAFHLNIVQEAQERVCSLL